MQNNTLEKLPMGMTQYAKNVLKPSLLELSQQLISPQVLQLAKQISSMSEYMQTISKQISVISNIVKPIIFNNVNNKMQEFLTNIRIIDGHWIVLDEELLELLKTKKTQKEMSKCIIEFYTENKYEKLIELFDEIDNQKIIPERIHIIKSCIQILKYSSKKHAYNVIIPTLLAQETGIIEEDCKELIPKNILLQKNKKGQISGIREVANALDKFDCSILFSRMIESAIKDGTFANVNMKEYKKYKKEYGNKSRHKIFHGDKKFLDYGKKENLIRVCLEIYALCRVKNILQLKINNIEVIENAK